MLHHEISDMGIFTKFHEPFMPEGPRSQRREAPVRTQTATYASQQAQASNVLDELWRHQDLYQVQGHLPQTAGVSANPSWP